MDVPSNRFFTEDLYFLKGEEERAKDYLISWKHFLFVYLSTCASEIRLFDQQWITRPTYDEDMNPQENPHTMKLQLAISGKWMLERRYKYEIG